MKKIILSVLLVNGVLLLACNSKQHGDVDTSLPQFGIEKNTTQAPVPVSDSLPATLNITQSVQNSVALNPPHGQPGHDCAVEVGAPLNQPVSPAPSQGIMTTPVPQTAKLNPPHGQPGHSCEIPVGQPLP